MQIDDPSECYESFSEALYTIFHKNFLLRTVVKKIARCEQTLHQQRNTKKNKEKAQT